MLRVEIQLIKQTVLVGCFDLGVGWGWLEKKGHLCGHKNGIILKILAHEFILKKDDCGRMDKPYIFNCFHLGL